MFHYRVFGCWRSPYSAGKRPEKRIPSESIGFGRIPSDSVGFRRTLSDSIGFYRTLTENNGFCRIPANLRGTSTFSRSRLSESGLPALFTSEEQECIIS